MLISVLLAGVLALGLVGCASAPTIGAAGGRVLAVQKVLDQMAAQAVTGSAEGVSALWVADRRADTVARFAPLLADHPPQTLTFQVVGLTVVDQGSLAQVVWRMRMDNSQRSGRFELLLTAGDPPLVAALRGENPFSARGATDWDGPSAPFDLAP